MVYHLSSWKQMLESSFPHIEGYFLVLEDNATGSIQAGLPIYLVKSWLLGTRLVSSPFATLCEPLLSKSSDLPLLLEGLTILKSNLGARRVEVRPVSSAPLLTNTICKRLDFYRQHTLALDRSLDEIFASFSKTAVRHMIVKAQRSDIVIQQIRTKEQFHQFLQLLLENRRHLALPSLPDAYFANLWHIFNPTRLAGFLASQDGCPIAGTLGLHFNGVFNLEFSARDAQKDRRGGNQLVYWETIKLARSLGNSVFHFGRTAATNAGLLQYKRHWGTVESNLPVFYLPDTPRDAPETSAAYHLVRGLIRIAPQFAQKPIGNFCYRHLG